MAEGRQLTKWELDKLIELGEPTQRQKEVLIVIHEEGSVVKAAQKLGVNHGTVSKNLTAVRKKAAKRGFAPSSLI